MSLSTPRTLTSPRSLATTAVAAGLLTLATAVPALADPTATATADLNGDGAADQVTTTAQADGAEQLLTATVGGQTYELVLPLATADGGVSAPRAVDTNRDGKDELVVTETDGDGTRTLELVDLGAGGLRVNQTPDGQVLRFFEGGGPGARSGYTCNDDFFGRRSFTILFAVATGEGDNPDFIGTLASYTVAGGLVTPTGQIPIFGVKGDNPQLVVDPNRCA